MLGMFPSAVDQTVVGTAMPRIIADLNGTKLYAWVFTAYMLTSTTAIPIVERIQPICDRNPKMASSRSFPSARALIPSSMPFSITKCIQS